MGMDLTDHEDALSRKGTSIRRGRRKKVSRPRPRIRRHVSDPIRSKIPNNGDNDDSHCRKSRIKQAAPDAASVCSSVTDFTEDHIVPLNTCIKNLSGPIISENVNGDNIEVRKWCNNNNLNNSHVKRQP